MPRGTYKRVKGVHYGKKVPPTSMQNEATMRKAFKSIKRAEPVHPFMYDRGITEAFIVVRADDYSLGASPRGGFAPAAGEYMGKGGMLWPSQAHAEKAAQWVLNKPDHKGKIYAVCKLVALVESPESILPPVVITKL